MLTVAYCRVSTEEQAAEGFSVAGQADKLPLDAELHELGEVTVIADPGLSGKNLERPGLQQLLHMVDAGHVANVPQPGGSTPCRGTQSDLILLADRFGQAGVALHSFTEKIDLSSATGRMFYNILGSFAQFYREQLAENVRMGMQQAVRQGKWVNRPKTGYDLIDRERSRTRLRPSSGASSPCAPRDRAWARSPPPRVSNKHSTVLTILRLRIYLAEVQMNGEWFPGRHEAIITPEPSPPPIGAGSGVGPGHRPAVGPGPLRLVQRLMALDQNGEGRKLYRCHHRGQGCSQPRRTNIGLHRAAVLGLRLIGDDVELQAAIRRELDRALTPAPKAGGGARTRRSRHGVEDLVAQRRKLLRLYYDDKVGADLFAEEEARLSVAIREAQREADDARVEVARIGRCGPALRRRRSTAGKPRHRQDVEGGDGARAARPDRRVHRGDFGVTRLPRREGARGASAARPLPGGGDEGVGF